MVYLKISENSKDSDLLEKDKYLNRILSIPSKHKLVISSEMIERMEKRKRLENQVKQILMRVHGLEQTL